ncbi:MAG: DNA-binding response regulator [Cytophagales bacterium]|nr:MAG: DNA-binding response regulator [Cytophagales bacterium]
MSLRAIAIDDEPLGLQILADDLLKIPTIELLGTFTRPFAALELIQSGRVDLLFLDIQMPTLLGTEFLRAMPRPPMTIFTTAYEQYALEGYELNVVDYLLKPIRFERLLRACTKAYDLHQRVATPQAIVQPTTPANPPDSFFFVKVDYKDVKIAHDDIRYIEGQKDYVKVFLHSQPNRPVLTRLNMKGIESLLDPAQFCRVHQSFIVPLSQITAVQKTRIMLGDLPIPVGERYADGFWSVYGKR